jgi:photosystem II stability/assembly factor-like uncharacterized protein
MITARRAFSVMLLLLISQWGSAQWVATNGPFSGQFTVMRAATVGGDVVVGSSRGIYRTTNNGQSWSNELSSPAHSLAGGGYLDLWAATDGGLYRSTDGGLTWRLTKAPESGDTKAVASSPTQLFLSSSMHTYLSTDNGASWDTLKLAGFNSLVFRPSSRIVLANAAGIYRSTNAGVSWTKEFSVTAGQSVWGLTYAPNGNIVGLAYLNTSPFRNVLVRSTDEGANWSTEAMDPPVDPQVLCPIGRYLCAGTAPNFSASLVNGRIYRSTNDGRTWTSAWSTTGPVSSLAMLNGNEGYAGCWSGLYVSSDTGVTWTRAKASYGDPQDIYSLAAGASRRVFAGTPAGAFRTTNGGTDWVPMLMDPATRLVRSIGMNVAGTAVYTGVGYGSVWFDNSMYRSTDGGTNWTSGGPLLSEQVYCQAPLASNNMIVGTEEAKAKRGACWHTTGGGVSWNPAGTMDSAVYALASNGLAEVMAGMKGGDISRSTDGGTYWSAKNPGGTADIRAIVYGGKAKWFAGTSAGALRTTNSGTSWTDINTGFALKTLIHSLAYDEQLGLFAGLATGGVYRSTNDGDQWTSISSGLPTGRVLALCIDSLGALYAGVYGNGVYKWTPPAVGVPGAGEVAPVSFALEQNFPNPFNPSTNVTYQVPVAGEVKLVVYDLLGKEVAVLVDGRKMPGQYTVRLDGGSMASGVYLYRLIVANFIATRKMVLMR